MSEYPRSLTAVYNGWDAYQGQLVRVIAPLSSEQLSLRPSPRLRSIGENAAHIINARIALVHRILGQGDASLEFMEQWDSPTATARSATELVEGLQATWQMIEHALASWTPADLDEVIPYTISTGQARSRTRQLLIWNTLEHDLHHGGEISFVLGMNELAGIEI